MNRVSFSVCHLMYVNIHSFHLNFQCVFVKYTSHINLSFSRTLCVFKITSKTRSKCLHMSVVCYLIRGCRLLYVFDFFYFQFFVFFFCFKVMVFIKFSWKHQCHKQFLGCVNVLKTFSTCFKLAAQCFWNIRPSC